MLKAVFSPHKCSVGEHWYGGRTRKTAASYTHMHTQLQQNFEINRGKRSKCLYSFQQSEVMDYLIFFAVQGKVFKLLHRHPLFSSPSTNNFHSDGDISQTRGRFVFCIWKQLWCWFKHFLRWVFRAAPCLCWDATLVALFPTLFCINIHSMNALARFAAV